MKKVYQVIEDFISDDGESIVGTFSTKEKAIKALEDHMGDSDYEWEPIGENHYELVDDEYQVELYIVERNVK